MSWKLCNCAMTSRDLLPALRAVRNQAQIGRFISDDELLAIAARAFAIAEREVVQDPEQLFYRHPGDRAEGEGGAPSSREPDQLKAKDAYAETPVRSRSEPSPSPALYTAEQANAIDAFARAVQARFADDVRVVLSRRPSWAEIMGTWEQAKASAKGGGE